MRSRTLTPFLKLRNFSGPVQQPDVRWEIQSLSWELPGGPKDATLMVTGSAASVYELIDSLRCPIEMLTEHGDPQWWGYVHEARIKTGTYEIGATLDSMANRVKLAYTEQTTGATTVGGRKTTSWSEDAESIEDFGTKEFLASGGNLSSATATARLAVVLGSMSRPQQTVVFARENRRAVFSEEVSGTLKCKGWWNTLGWRYASIGGVSGISYETTSATEQGVGSTSSNTKMMQVFSLGGRAMNAVGLSVYAKKSGTPTDNLVLALYKMKDDDTPDGSAVGTVTIAGADVGSSLAWLGGTFSSEVQMDPTKDYCVHVSRSGAVDASHYFRVNVNESLGDTNGFFRIWNGSAWVARSTDADLVYTVDVNNYTETTNQIYELATTFGEFLSGVEIEAGSGVMQPSYRDGDTLVMAEIDELLKTGGANGRRLLATVDRDRRLIVWEEPASTATAYRITGDGILTDSLGVPLTDINPPLGNWIRLSGLVPESADVSKLIAPNKQFLEGASWTPANGLVPKSRGRPSIEDMFKVMR